MFRETWIWSRVLPDLCDCTQILFYFLSWISIYHINNILDSHQSSSLVFIFLLLLFLLWYIRDWEIGIYDQQKYYNQGSNHLISIDSILHIFFSFLSKNSLSRLSSFLFLFLLLPKINNNTTKRSSYKQFTHDISFFILAKHI